MPLNEIQVDAPSTSLTGSARADEETYRRTFLVMCLCFGLNHAAVTTPVGYASSLLGLSVGNASNATLYGMCLLSSLFLGPLFTSSFGPKNALCLGMCCYCVYVLCFAFATGTTFQQPFDAETLAKQTDPAKMCQNPGSTDEFCSAVTCNAFGWTIAIGGSIIGGVGAGSMWTAQGAFFGAICESLSEATNAPLQSLTAQLSSTFAVWYLGQECLWKVTFTVLTVYLLPSFIDNQETVNVIAFVIYAIMAATATILMYFAQDARSKNDTGVAAPLCARAAGAFKLWPEPTLWLLSGLNITFGIAAAYLGGYINAHWEMTALTSALGSPEAATGFIGFLGAIICLVATISSKIYGALAEKMGTKLPIVVFGCLCFFLMAILSFISAPDGEGPGGWGWGIIVFYLLQGLGRGVYESTNKGIFGDYFQGEKAPGAFANCMMQSTASSTVMYLMGSLKVAQYDVWPLLVFSLATVPGLVVADCMRSPQADKTSDP